VQQHAATFFAQAEDAAGADLPQFVKDEFDAFLECGILAHGLLRLHCGDCGHDKLVAFSCRRRGFCPSCGARRMAQTAAHLVDHCPNCGGELKIIAAILEQSVIEKILTHLGLQARAPPRAPARVWGPGVTLQRQPKKDDLPMTVGDRFGAQARSACS
jgi:hypothetical protein